MRVSKKAYAKINLCLTVFQKNEQGFHNLESLVTTVDLFDKVTLSTRKDKKITLTGSGSNKEYLYSYIPEKDNAYRAVKAYMESTGCNGADILLQKNIPLSSGMGGSSTCASAALLCMEELYQMGADLPALANSLGSDTNYLLKGGWAVLKGRGEIVEYLPCKKKLKMVAIYSDGGVDTGKCFNLFDELKQSENAINSDIGALIDSLSTDELDYSQCKNSLTSAACIINPNVKKAIDFTKTLSPSALFMTGSGATVCAIFEYDGLLDWAVQKLKQEGFECEILTTVIPKN